MELGGLLDGRGDKISKARKGREIRIGQSEVPHRSLYPNAHGSGFFKIKKKKMHQVPAQKSRILFEMHELVGSRPDSISHLFASNSCKIFLVEEGAPSSLSSSSALSSSSSSFPALPFDVGCVAAGSFSRLSRPRHRYQVFIIRRQGKFGFCLGQWQRLFSFWTESHGP